MKEQEIKTSLENQLKEKDKLLLEMMRDQEEVIQVLL